MCQICTEVIHCQSFLLRYGGRVNANKETGSEIATLYSSVIRTQFLFGPCCLCVCVRACVRAHMHQDLWIWQNVGSNNESPVPGGRL